MSHSSPLSRRSRPGLPALVVKNALALPTEPTALVAPAPTTQARRPAGRPKTPAGPTALVCPRRAASLRSLLCGPLADRLATETRQFVTASEVASLLGVSVGAWFAWVANDWTPPAVRIGPRVTRWRVADIRAWVAAGCPFAGRADGDKQPFLLAASRTDAAQEARRAAVAKAKARGYLTGTEVAAKLNMSLSAWRERVREGLAPTGTKIDGQVFWLEADIDRWLKTRARGGRPRPTRPAA